MVNEILQAKINYFFKPYSGEISNDSEPPMNFREQGQAPVKTNDSFEFDEDAKKHWNQLCKTILKNDDKELRNFLTKINPTMYCRLKNIGQQYYLNEFVKSSEINQGSSNWGSSKNCELDSESSSKNIDPVIDGISILKSLILDKIVTKLDEQEDRSHFQSTFNPKLNSLTESITKQPKRKKRVKVRSKVSWKNAETIIPCQYLSCSTKKIDTQKMYKNLMKEWQDEQNFKNLAESSSKSINFNQPLNRRILRGRASLPQITEKKDQLFKLKVSSQDLKYSTMNSEKFILEIQKKKDSERMEKFKSQSLSRPSKRFVPVSGNTLKMKKDSSNGFLKPLHVPKRVKILTPLCLNTSCSSALSVSMCSEKEAS
jgi:hypothetical protein